LQQVAYEQFDSRHGGMLGMTVLRVHLNVCHGSLTSTESFPWPS
jgi:hypothetical protein